MAAMKKDISNHFPGSVRMHKHSCVKQSMFHHCNSNSAIFRHLLANTPDVVISDESSEVFVLEVGSVT